MPSLHDAPLKHNPCLHAQFCVRTLLPVSPIVDCGPALLVSPPITKNSPFQNGALPMPPRPSGSSGTNPLSDDCHVLVPGKYTCAWGRCVWILESLDLDARPDSVMFSSLQNVPCCQPAILCRHTDCAPSSRTDDAPGQLDIHCLECFRRLARQRRTSCCRRFRPPHGSRQLAWLRTLTRSYRPAANKTIHGVSYRGFGLAWFPWHQLGTSVLHEGNTCNPSVASARL